MAGVPILTQEGGYTLSNRDHLEDHYGYIVVEITGDVVKVTWKEVGGTLVKDLTKGAPTG